MDDTAFRRYFTQPTQTYHRQYEALRAVIIDGRSQKEVAEAFGFQHCSLRQLMYEFRRSFSMQQPLAESPTVPPSPGSTAIASNSTIDDSQANTRKMSVI